jgi:hypothetical protein
MQSGDSLGFSVRLKVQIHSKMQAESANISPIKARLVASAGFLLVTLVAALAAMATSSEARAYIQLGPPPLSTVVKTGY